MTAPSVASRRARSQGSVHACGGETRRSVRYDDQGAGAELEDRVGHAIDLRARGALDEHRRGPRHAPAFVEADVVRLVGIRWRELGTHRFPSGAVSVEGTAPLGISKYPVALGSNPSWCARPSV